MKIQIIYDNESKNGFKGGWGFACIVNTHHNKILFDTGWNGNILLYNLQLAGISFEDIDKIILSHTHWDHIGGLNHILEKIKPDIYLCKSTSKNLKKELGKYSNLFEVSKPLEICENTWTTGELGNNIKEQSLILNTDKGLVVLTGCAHPGLESILKQAKKFGNIHALIGGFHDFKNIKLLKDIPLILPCHCTIKKEKIIQYYTKSAQKCKAGFLLNFNDN